MSWRNAMMINIFLFFMYATYMFCCRHTMQILQSYQTIKKGCIKNIKYIMLKHYKQEHLHFYQHLVLPQHNIDSHDTYDIMSHNPIYNCVNQSDSISTITSSSKSNHTNSVTLSSSTVDTQAINSLFYQFKHFESQPNQLYFFPQHVSLAPWWCTWHFMACS